MEKLIQSLKDKNNTVETYLRLSDSIFLSAEIEGIKLTRKQCRGLARNVHADIINGRV